MTADETAGPLSPQLTCSPDGLWCCVRQGADLVCYALGHEPIAEPSGRVQLPDPSTEVVLLGPPSMVLTVTRVEDATLLQLLQQGTLDAVAELSLAGGWSVGGVTGSRVVLIAQDARSCTLVRATGRSLVAQLIDPGGIVDLAIGMERHQVAIATTKKLELWDAVAGRPLTRLQLQLPPPPRTVGTAAGHWWALRPDRQQILLLRLSDGRPFPHLIGATIRSVISHPASPWLVVITNLGLLRLSCYAHALVAIDVPAAECYAIAPSGEDAMLLGASDVNQPPWRLRLSVTKVAAPHGGSPGAPVQLAPGGPVAASVLVNAPAGPASAADTAADAEPAVPGGAEPGPPMPAAWAFAAVPSGREVPGSGPIGSAPRDAVATGPREAAPSAPPASGPRNAAAWASTARPVEPTPSAPAFSAPSASASSASSGAGGSVHARPSTVVTHAAPPMIAVPTSGGPAGGNALPGASTSERLRALRDQVDEAAVREARDAMLARDGAQVRDPREARDAMLARDGAPVRDPREARDDVAGGSLVRDARDAVPMRDAREGAPVRDARDAVPVRDARDGAPVREVREGAVVRGPWRAELARYGADIAAGTRVSPPLGTAELATLAKRLELPESARQTSTVLYAAWLAGAPFVPMSRLAAILGEGAWAEALGTGALGQLGLLRHRDGAVALRRSVLAALDGRPWAAIRTLGDHAGPAGPVTRLPREVARIAVAAWPAWFEHLGKVALVTGKLRRAIVEARIADLVAVTFEPLLRYPAPWPAGARLLVVTDAVGGLTEQLPELPAEPPAGSASKS